MLPTPGKIVRKFHENFVFYHPKNTFFLKWTNDVPILRKKIGFFWEIQKKSRNFPIILPV